MDPRVAQPSMLRRWEPPPYTPAAPEPAPPPPLTYEECHTCLAQAIERHTEASDRVAQLELAQTRAQQACRAAQTAVDEADALLAEAKEDEPKSYVARLLRNGDASDPIDEVDLIEMAERRLAEARRKLTQARQGEAIIGEEVNKARNHLTYAEMGRDSATKALIASHPAVQKLRERYAKALVKAAELRLALSEVGRHLPPRTLPNDVDVHSESVVSLRAPRIETDGTVAAAWRSALAALESDPDAKLPEAG